jgi:hypothetical protein
MRAVLPPFTSQGAETPVYVAFFYPDNQFAVILQDLEARRVGDEFSGCFKDDSIVISWSPTFDYTFDMLPLVASFKWESYPTLKEAIGMDKEEFFMTYENWPNNSVCFSTPEDIWSDPIYGEGP